MGWTSRKNPDTVAARDVQKGDSYMSSPSGGDGAKRFGRLPRVTRTNYLEHGEGGEPTVYLETSDGPGVYCLYPDEPVNVRKRRR